MKESERAAIEHFACDNGCDIWRVSDGTGDAVMTKYKVFPGIFVIFNDIHTRHLCCLQHERERPKNILEINHCREGRIERRRKEGQLHLCSGDLTVHMKSSVMGGAFFPSSHYHGVTILIDLDESPKCLSCLLEDVDVEPELLIERFSLEDNVYVCRSNSHMEHVFSEIYSIPDYVRKGYLKIKVLEILLFLSVTDIDPDDRKSCSSQQVTLASMMNDYLCQNLFDNITIKALSDRFHVSASVIKDCFKDVYGVSVYAYIRSLKMESAAVDLKLTDKTVIEIAGSYGYANAGKFAAAFKSVMGELPSEYRKKQK